MGPGLEFLISKSVDRDNEKLEDFAQSAIDEYIEGVKNVNESILNRGDKEELVEKMKKIQIYTGVFARNFTENYFEEFYDELNLKGNESLLKSALEIKAF